MPVSINLANPVYSFKKLEADCQGLKQIQAFKSEIKINNNNNKVKHVNADICISLFYFLFFPWPVFSFGNLSTDKSHLDKTCLGKSISWKLG